MHKQIYGAHFGIADITGLNRNVLIELGAITSLNKPFIMFRKLEDTLPLPFDIAGYQCYPYTVSNGSIVTYNAADTATRVPLSQIINTFILEELKRNSAFNDAKEWFGE